MEIVRLISRWIFPLAWVINMSRTKDILLEQIMRRAQQEAAYLAGEFARAASEEKGAILDALELEQWLAASCADCLDRP